MRAQFLLPSLFCFTGLVWLSPPSAIAESSPATNPAPVKTQQLQLVPSPDTAVGFNNIPGLFNRAVNNNTGRFYDYTNILGQFNSLFGWRTFPQGSYFDNMITRDAKLTETLYYDVMQQQQSGPLIRTQDLP
ncbi:MAG: porin, partial [Microcystis sp. M53601_WE4]|nr:porin [Microcystis sp. M53601_WE4]